MAISNWIHFVIKNAKDTTEKLEENKKFYPKNIK